LVFYISEQHRLRVFEYRVLKGILGLKRDEFVGCLRKLHNEKLHNLYVALHIIKTTI
jgi:hypothetical protein